MIDTTRPYRWTLYAGQLVSATARTDNTPRETLTLAPIDPRGNPVLGMGPLILTTPHVIPEEVAARIRHDARIVIEFDRTARVASVDGQRFAYPEDIDHEKLVNGAVMARSSLGELFLSKMDGSDSKHVNAAIVALDNALGAKPAHIAAPAPALSPLYNLTTQAHGMLRDYISPLRVYRDDPVMDRTIASLDAILHVLGRAIGAKENETPPCCAPKAPPFIPTSDTAHSPVSAHDSAYNDESRRLRVVLHFIARCLDGSYSPDDIASERARINTLFGPHAEVYRSDIERAIATAGKLLAADADMKQRVRTKIKHDEEVGRMRRDLGEKQRREDMAQKALSGMSDALSLIVRVLSYNYSDDAVERSIQALPECWRAHALAALAARRRIESLVTADEAKANTGNTVAMLVTEATCALGGVHDKSMTANQLALHAIHSLRDRLGAAERFRMTADVVRRGVAPAVKALRTALSFGDMPQRLAPELDALENGLALLDTEAK